MIDDRLSKAHGQAEQEQALLNIKVIDPACGSGHFLLAAARRLAVAIAQVRAGDDQPSEDDRQHALRDVVAHCIYAVDRNPMAVELCKVALWIEAIDPGKPLSFLDAHIQCGDSLVGVFDPKVLEEGIPDEAYKQLTGDDKTVCTSLKKENAAARKTISRGGSNRGIQGSLNLSGTQPRSQGHLQGIEAMPETTLAETAAKQAAYAKWLADHGRDSETLAADLYTATFFLAKTSDSRDRVPTSEHLLKLLARQPVEEVIEEAVVHAAKNFRFFHWHLRFGEVLAKGGFDCVLGNPPWERIKLQEKEFFAVRSEAIATAPNKAARERLIKALSASDASEADRQMVQDLELAKREAEGSAEFIRGSKRFVLTAVGDLNTYTLFSELSLALVSQQGRAGLVIPTGISTDSSTSRYFQQIVASGRLVSLLSFENELFIFAGVHHSYRFCLFTLTGNLEEPGDATYAFYLRAISQLTDPRRMYQLSSEDISLCNPNSMTCPLFRSRVDADLTRSIYKRSPVLISEESPASHNPWGIRYMTQMYHMSHDSHLFSREQKDGYIPLYEAKFLHHYDHRWSTSSISEGVRSVSTVEKSDPSFEIRPNYWVCAEDAKRRLSDQNWHRDWIIGWRAISAAHNIRSFIGSALPLAGVGNSCHVVLLGEGEALTKALCFIGSISSLVVDYIARQKIGGANFSFFIAMQLPILPPEAYSATDCDFINPRVLSLIYTSNALASLAHDKGFDGAPFEFDLNRRSVIRAELDAYYAHLYGLSRDELRYVLDPADVMGPDYPSETFRVLKNNEIREFGEYRTQRLVLEAWDCLFGE